MRIIDYIWYRLYRGSLKSELKRPRYLLASAVLALCLHLNVIGLSYTLFFFFDIPFIYRGVQDWIVNSITIVLTLFTFLLYRAGRGRRVYAKYRKETPTHKKICTILTALYFIFTCVTTCLGSGILRWIKYGYFPY